MCQAAAWWSAAEWYTWALLTPLVIRLVRRVRAGERFRPRTLAALAAGGLIIAALQVGLEYVSDHLVVLLTGDPSVSVGVWLSGGVRGEVGRIWLLFMPFACLFAAAAPARPGAPRPGWPATLAGLEAGLAFALAASMVFVA